MMKWLWPTLVVSGVVCLVVLYWATRNKKLAAIAVDVIENLHAPHIRHLQSKSDELTVDLKSNAAEVRKLNAEVANRKAEIAAVYSMTDLSAADVKKRIDKLRLK